VQYKTKMLLKESPKLEAGKDGSGGSGSKSELDVSLDKSQSDDSYEIVDDENVATPKLVDEGEGDGDHDLLDYIRAGGEEWDKRLRGKKVFVVNKDLVA